VAIEPELFFVTLITVTAKPGAFVSAPKAAKGRWVRTAVLTAAVCAWRNYDMATATEAPSQAMKLLQLFLLACAGIACLGSRVMLARPD
jgi:hypothetical protein